MGEEARPELGLGHEQGARHGPQHPRGWSPQDDRCGPERQVGRLQHKQEPPVGFLKQEAHNPGTSLEMKVNHAGAKFKGFKIAKTGNGNEREITWNGKKLAKGDFTMSDKRFTTTQTLSNGKSLTTTI